MIAAATEKKIIALRNSKCLGITKMQKARIKFYKIAAKPFPSISAPIYLPGKAPPRPKVELCIIPRDMANNANSAMTTQSTTLGSEINSAVRGITNINTAMMKYYTVILICSETV